MQIRHCAKRKPINCRTNMYAKLFSYDWMVCLTLCMCVSLTEKLSICTLFINDSFICRVSIGDGHKGIAMKGLRKTCTNYANPIMARNAFLGPFLIGLNYAKLEQVPTILQWEQADSSTIKAHPQTGVNKLAQGTMATLPSHSETIGSGIQKITSLVFGLIRWSLFLSWKQSSWK